MFLILSSTAPHTNFYPNTSLQAKFEMWYYFRNFIQLQAAQRRHFLHETTHSNKYFLGFPLIYAGENMYTKANWITHDEVKYLAILHKNPARFVRVFILGKESRAARECEAADSMLDIPAWLRIGKVQRISGGFLAERSPYILYCDWNFSPRVNPLRTTLTNMASNWPVCISRISKHETTPSLAALWLGRKKRFLAPISMVFHLRQKST